MKIADVSNPILQAFLADVVLRSMPMDSIETDNDGQLVIYTGIYRWKDGSYHDKAEQAYYGHPVCAKGD
jgi:hypothetical protein